MVKYRIEKDSMGEVKIRDDVLWGAQTQRAIENFPISGLVFPSSFIKILGLIKNAACKVNMSLGLITKKNGTAICKAATEVMVGKLDKHFPLDIFQTGSGTSTNMNANEVIANRANILLGSKSGQNPPIHPNDHVNKGQSSNDVIPSAIHISAALTLDKNLIPALGSLYDHLNKKGTEFRNIPKLGRTHLQDALPIRLGQEFDGYSVMIKKGIERIKSALTEVLKIPLGGTAVGTSLNSHPQFAKMVIKEISSLSNLKLKKVDNHFESQGAKDALVFLSSALKSLSVSLFKILQDIRLSASGPFGGLGELNLPEVQPGSSIMPGKVNPVIIESLLQVTIQVMANDQATAHCGMLGQFELNAMMPLMAHNILFNIEILTNGINMFIDKCLGNLTVNQKHCLDQVNSSLALVTALVPEIGYDLAAKIAKEAFTRKKSLKQILIEKKVIAPNRIDDLLDPLKMI